MRPRWTRNTWNITEASRCIYTLICPLTGPATNPCPGNGLGHLLIVKRPNDHIISLQLVIYIYACEHWLIAAEPYDRIPTWRFKQDTELKSGKASSSKQWLLHLPIWLIATDPYDRIPTVTYKKGYIYIYIYIYII